MTARYALARCLRRVNVVGGIPDKIPPILSLSLFPFLPAESSWVDSDGSSVLSLRNSLVTGDERLPPFFGWVVQGS